MHKYELRRKDAVGRRRGKLDHRMQMGRTRQRIVNAVEIKEDHNFVPRHIAEVAPQVARTPRIEDGTEVLGESFDHISWGNHLRELRFGCEVGHV